MSQHHRAQNWPTTSRKLRPQIEAMLPLPCVDCGHLVTRDHKWDVGHRPGHEASRYEPATLNTVGPSHRRSEAWPVNCNQIAGGRQGAAISNAKRRNKTGDPRW